jgi:hypothetical protein
MWFADMGHTGIATPRDLESWSCSGYKPSNLSGFSSPLMDTWLVFLNSQLFGPNSSGQHGPLGPLPLDSLPEPWILTGGSWSVFLNQQTSVVCFMGPACPGPANKHTFARFWGKPAELSSIYQAWNAGVKLQGCPSRTCLTRTVCSLKCLNPKQISMGMPTQRLHQMSLEKAITELS